MTNVYIVGGRASGETYTPYFAAAGFRYAQVSGFPATFTPTAEMLVALRVHSDVTSASELRVPNVDGTSMGTPNVLQRVHDMTRASQSSNLWSIPTDCPQRERRGWVSMKSVAAIAFAISDKLLQCRWPL
jgi:alpha-L-rhamnosidase